MTIVSTFLGGFTGFLMAIVHVVALGGSLLSGIAIWSLVGLVFVSAAVVLSLTLRPGSMGFSGFQET